mmetsp:Transcript_37556/g.76620  ORF Transcript_37556/g.76620 Transcript_37556/m.76620 type:complete len:201 (-) Transcript_37556:78-680(-)
MPIPSSAVFSQNVQTPNLSRRPQQKSSDSSWEGRTSAVLVALALWTMAVAAIFSLTIMRLIAMVVWRAMPAPPVGGSQRTLVIGRSGTAPFLRCCSQRGWVMGMPTTAKIHPESLKRRLIWYFASSSASAGPLAAIPTPCGPGTTTSPSDLWTGTCASPLQMRWMVWCRSSLLWRPAMTTSLGIAKQLKLLLPPLSSWGL